jgi:hypothetical protein
VLETILRKLMRCGCSHSQNMQITAIAILLQFHSHFQRHLCSRKWRYIHLKFVNTLLFESVFNSLHLPVHRCVIGMSCDVQFPTAAFYCVPQAVTSQGWTNCTLLSLRYTSKLRGWGMIKSEWKYSLVCEEVSECSLPDHKQAYIAFRGSDVGKELILQTLQQYYTRTKQAIGSFRKNGRFSTLDTNLRDE